MVPASELKVLVGVYGIEEANRKLLGFDKDVKALTSDDGVVTLRAEVDHSGFDEFELLKKAAGMDSTAEVHFEATGIDVVTAQLESIRAMTKVPIVQEVKLEIDKSSLAALGAADLVGHAGGSSARPVPVPAGAPSAPSQAQITEDMVGLRQWTNSHETFWDSTGPPGGKSTAADVAAAESVARGSGGGDAGGILGFLGGAASRGGGGDKGLLPSILWGHHGGGGGGPWWMRAALGGGLLAGAGSLGSFAGFGAEHLLFTGLGIAGSAGGALLGGGLVGAGALGTMAVGGGSDLAVMKSTIADTTTLGQKYKALQEAVTLYGRDSKQAAAASARLHATMKELGPIAGPELSLAKRAMGLDSFWDEQTQKARRSAVEILGQGVTLAHDYVPLIGHAAATNLAIIDQDLKPLFKWLEGPEGTGIFEHLEGVFAHNLPNAMGAFDQGVQLVLKTVSVASNYTGGFVESLDDFFTKWNEPQNFQKWEGEIGHLVGDFHLWLNLIKQLGVDIFDLFSNDAHTGETIVRTLDGMLIKVHEWETSTQGKEDLHNLFTVHKEEIVALLHLIPEFVSAIEPIYMTVAPFLTEAVTEILGDVGSFLKLLDETGPITRWGLGLTLIAGKLLGFKTVFGFFGKGLLAPFESLLAKAPLIGGMFVEEESATEKLTGATEGLTTAVGDLTAAYETMGAAASDAQMSLFGETTAAEESAAAAGQMSLFPMGAGLAGAGAGATASAEAEGITGAEAAGGGLLAGVGSTLSKGLTVLGGVAGGYFAAEFGAKAIEGITGADLLENQSLLTSLTHGFNTEHVAETEASALQRQKASESAAKAGERIDAELRSGIITRLPDIVALAHEASGEFAKGMHNEGGWRAVTGENMQAVIDAIKAGEKQGAISVEEGQQQIAHYLREYNLVTGDDPFHIASSFTHTWAEAGHVNESGISRALAELRKMPPVSQAIAEQTMLQQVHQFERGGELAQGTFSRLRSAIITQLQQTREHGGSQVEMFSSEMEGSFGTLSINVAHALENIGVNVGGLLEKLGAHNPLQSFALHYIQGHPAAAGSGSKYLGQIAPLGQQRGGHIDLGDPTGDSVPALLERGEYVLNRNAVAAVGVGHLDALNYGSHARFQAGGHIGALGPEPKLQGPQGALLTLGDAAIHMGYAAAQHYLGMNLPKTTASGGSVNLSGLEGNRFDIAAQEVRRAHAPHLAILALFEALIDEGGPFSNVLEGEGAGIGAPIMSAAREIAGFLTGVPTWTGNGSAIGLARAHPKMPAWEIAQIIQASGAGAASHGRDNYGSHQSEAEAMMHRYGYAEGGIVDMGAVAGHPGMRLTPAQHQAYLAWKWGRRLAEGGLIGREEGRMGVPNSTATSEARKAQRERASRQTPTEIVHWAMQHIGQSSPWDSQYPGEWCGDFLADDFRSHGMPVPSGYAAAANWGSYGTALGRGHMQAGAVIDYDGRHVALAISSSEMIQGNDVHGVVGTSEIAGSVGGSPITAVRWPPYSKGHGPGAGSAPTEKVPGEFKGARTKSLSFPSVPSSLHAIAVEIHRWRGELEKYEHATHLATGRPELQRALTANVTRIQKHLRELERARHKLRRETARKHYSHHLARQLGKITGEEKNIELAQRAYEVASQYAEQVVGLEPTEPVLGQAPAEATEAQIRQVEEANHGIELAHLSAYEAFVEGRERPAYMNVLGTEAEWRNTILSAESKATGLEAAWETRIHSDDAMIAGIPRHFGHVKDRVDAWRKAHPHAKHLPTILGREWEAAQYEMTLLPELRFKDRELRKVLGEGRQAFYPGFSKALQPPQPPLPGSGQFEQAMQEVQGIHWPAQHEHLAVASLMPPRHAGSFGGAIWDTQTAIEELGLKIQQAQAGISSVGAGGEAGSISATVSAAESERTQLLEELLRQAHEREMVDELARQTFSSAHVGMPFAGGYESGGMVAALVGEGGPEIIATRPGSYIRNASETSNLLSPTVRVHVHGDIHSDRDDPIEVFLNDERFPAAVERVTGKNDRQGARVARRGLATPGYR